MNQEEHNNEVKQQINGAKWGNNMETKAEICYCRDTELSVPHYKDDHTIENTLLTN